MPNNPRPADKVQELWEAQQKVVRLKGELALAEAAVEQLEYTTLPDLFLSNGMSELRLPNGVKAIRTIHAKGALPSHDSHPEQHAEAVGWMIENGYVNNLDTRVEGRWAKGEHDKAVAFYDTLRGDNSVSASIKSYIHWATYCKLIKERVLNHPELTTPTEMLGVVIRPRVAITGKPREE